MSESAETMPVTEEPKGVTWRPLPGQARLMQFCTAATIAVRPAVCRGEGRVVWREKQRRELKEDLCYASVVHSQSRSGAAGGQG